MEKNKTKSFWDKSIQEYNQHMKETGHYTAQEKLFLSLEKYFKSPILDLAAGPGFLADLLLQKDFEVQLNDFSEKVVQGLKRRFNKDVQIYSQDAHIIKLNTKFNTIISCNLFYYITDADNALNHWKELLTETGSIILFEEYPFKVTNTADSFSKQEDELMKVVSPKNPDHIVKTFKEYGLKLQEKKSVKIDNEHNLIGFVFKK